MGSTAGTILFLAVIIGVVLLWGVIKEKLKRNVFQKDRYDEEQRLTKTRIRLQTNVARKEIESALDRYIPTDSSVKGAIVGDTYKCTSLSNGREYLHRSKITSNGGDAFNGRVIFAEQDGGLVATGQITEWYEHDGVTGKAGIEAMREFMDNIERAFRAADPNGKIEKLT